MPFLGQYHRQDISMKRLISLTTLDDGARRAGARLCTARGTFARATGWFLGCHVHLGGPVICGYGYSPVYFGGLKASRMCRAYSESKDMLVFNLSNASERADSALRSAASASSKLTVNRSASARSG